MKSLQHVRTRRQLFRVTAVNPNGTNQNGTNQNGNPQNGTACFLKDTKISTPSGDRLVQDLQTGDEVETLAGRKTIKWIGYNKFTKEEGRLGKTQ